MKLHLSTSEILRVRSLTDDAIKSMVTTNATNAIIFVEADATIGVRECRPRDRPFGTFVLVSVAKDPVSSRIDVTFNKIIAGSLPHDAEASLKDRGCYGRIILSDFCTDSKVVITTGSAPSPTFRKVKA